MLGKIIINSLIGVILMMNVNVPVQGGEITVSGLLKWNSGNYVYPENTSTTYLYPTLRYKTEHYFVSISLPLIAQNTDLITHMGGGIIPSEHGHDEESPADGHNHGMFSGGHMGDHAMNWTLGDLFLNTGKTIVKERDNIPTLSFTALIKLPTASTENNIGTGKADFGFGFSASKNMGFVYGFWDINYYLLGDPQGIELINPFALGFGLGKQISDGKISLLAYYFVYTEILEDVEPPREITFNTNYRVNSRYQINGGLSAGFSESSPDFGLFVGSSVSF